MKSIQSPDAKWTKRGVILERNSQISWLAGGVGPCFARIDPKDKNVIHLYVSGRDSNHRSCIARVLFDLRQGMLLEVSNEPVMALGTKGAFDEYGTSYPYIVEQEGVFFFMIRNHPHQNVYFNELVGGVNGADGKFDMDYWGLSYKQLYEKLLKQVNPQDRNSSITRGRFR